MSQENVEIVRQLHEDFNRGDFDAASPHFDPDVEWHVLDVFPDAQVYRGREEIMRFFETWRGTIGQFRVGIERIVDAGERVLVLGTASGSGRGSEAELRTPTYGQLWTFNAGRITRVEMLPPAEALEAVGLEE